MARISPFRAVRPKKEFVQDVAAFPYDVVNSAEARVIAQDNPVSFLHISKAEIDLAETAAFDHPDVYQKAKSNLESFLDRGILVQDVKPFIYVYAQKMGNHKQYGIVATVHVSEFEAGRVKKHELTLPQKEEDRTRHFDTLNAQTGPLFLTYRGQGAINRLIAEITQAEPEYDFKLADGIAHTVWVVSEEKKIHAILDEFDKIDSLYIADGHHRAASAVTVARKRRQRNPMHSGNEEYNFILSVLFPQDQLKILDYNRAVKDLNGLDRDHFLKQIETCFQISAGFSQKSPGSLHEFGMYISGQWYKLTAKAECYRNEDLIGALDVSILQRCLLGSILGIGDPRQDQRIKFIGGMRGMGELERLVDSGEFAVAFSLFPPSVEQMIQVADSGAIMPPKSTWFEPKLRSGLFVHLLD